MYVYIKEDTEWFKINQITLLVFDKRIVENPIEIDDVKSDLVLR